MPFTPFRPLLWAVLPCWKVMKMPWVSRCFFPLSGYQDIFLFQYPCLSAFSLQQRNMPDGHYHYCKEKYTSPQCFPNLVLGTPRGALLVNTTQLIQMIKAWWLADYLNQLCSSRAKKQNVPPLGFRGLSFGETLVQVNQNNVWKTLSPSSFDIMYCTCQPFSCVVAPVLNRMNFPSCVYLKPQIPIVHLVTMSSQA